MGVIDADLSLAVQIRSNENSKPSRRNASLPAEGADMADGHEHPVAQILQFDRREAPAEQVTSRARSIVRTADINRISDPRGHNRAAVRRTGHAVPKGMRQRAKAPGEA